MDHKRTSPYPRHVVRLASGGLIGLVAPWDESLLGHKLELTRLLAHDGLLPTMKLIEC